MTPANDRRQRLHDLVIALIAQQDDLPLLDPDQPDLEGTAPGRWLDQNRRSLHRYQALVRTAVTLDARWMPKTIPHHCLQVDVCRLIATAG